MAKLSSHILDTALGKPAHGVRIDLFRREDDGYRLIKTLNSNADGRTDELLLDANEMAAGDYELLFHVGDYFSNKHRSLSQPYFLNEIPIRFGIANNSENFHVPLLLSPWSYSTYRGS